MSIGRGRPRSDATTDPFAVQVGEIGPRVRMLRDRKSLSLSDVAVMSARAGHGIDPTFLSRWERGERRPTVADVLVMCRVLKVSVAEMVAEETAERVK